MTEYRIREVKMGPETLFYPEYISNGFLGFCLWKVLTHHRRSKSEAEDDIRKDIEYNNRTTKSYELVALLGLGTFTIIGLPSFITGYKFDHMPLLYTGIVLGFIAVVLLAAMFIKMGIELHREHKENMKKLGPPPENKKALSTSTNRIMDFFSKEKI